MKTIYSFWDWLIWAILGGFVVGIIIIQLQDWLKKRKTKENVTKFIEHHK